jgi:long-chain acyl-CoA synthetase
VNSFLNLSKHKKKIAIISENEEAISYLSLENKINKIKKRIRKRSLIFILSSNTLDSIIVYLTSLKHNCVCLLLENDIIDKNLNILIKKYKPNYIFTDRVKKIVDYKEFIKFKKNIILKKTTNNNTNFFSELSLLLSTSGSTGSPKLARISLNNIISNANSIAKYSKIKSSDTMITTLNPAYSFGLSMINSHLLKGARIILNQDTLISNNFWMKLEKFKISTIGGVPFMYEIFDRLKIFKKKTFIKNFLQAGGPLNINLQKKFSKICKKKKISFFIMYGQTEASPRISYLPTRNLLKKLGSIGVPIPGGKIKIIDDLGNEITKPNISGELEYQGDNVFLGYANNLSDLKKGDMNKGILKTGDIAYRDRNSFYFITGRKKRIVKIFGKRINLDDLEQNINRSKIKNVCISNRDKLIIFIDAKKNISRLKKILLKNMKLNKISFEISYITNIPRLNNGKINYSKINKLVNEKKFN